MSQQLPPPVQLMQMLFGFAASGAFGFAAELVSADFIKDEVKTVEELAQQTNMHRGHCTVNSNRRLTS